MSEHPSTCQCPPCVAAREREAIDAAERALSSDVPTRFGFAHTHPGHDGVCWDRHWTWVWPFPRLRYRLRHGHWCTHWDGDPQHWNRHPDNGGWIMIDCGMRQMRRCPSCDWVEFR